MPEIKEHIKRVIYLSITKKLFLVLFGLTLSLFIAEVSLRAINITRDLLKGRRVARLSDNRVLGYELKPNYQHGMYRINNHGFRGKDIDIKEGKDAFRIVAVGDSITFGSRLKEEDIYPSLLEGYLNKGELNRHFEVINTGVGGYNIWQYLEIYKEKVRILSPDLVIVGICQNDFEVVGPYHVDFFGMVRGDFDAETRKGLLDNLAIYRTVSNRIKMYSLTRDEKGQDAVRTMAPSLSRKWTDGSVPLKELVKITKEDNIPVFFVIFPYRFQIKENDSQTDEKLIEFMKDNTLFYIDLLDSFRKNSQELYVKGDYVHPNELGHNITADLIYRFLVDNRVIETNIDGALGDRVK